MRPIEAPSPNFGPRRGGAVPDLVVLHYTAMPSAEAALARLRDPAAEVSCHWLIAEDGRTWRLVDETARAWHAGVGSWGGLDDVNSRSIGVELANAGPLQGFPPFPEAQMTALERLLDGVLARWGIAPERVLGHSDTAPGRKVDPGPKFDWRRLARGGRAVWVDAAQAPQTGEAAWASFRTAAARAGYGSREADWTAVLAGFRLRFRPWVRDADLQAADVAAITALAAAYPCVDAGGSPA